MLISRPMGGGHWTPVDRPGAGGHEVRQTIQVREAEQA